MVGCDSEAEARSRVGKEASDSASPQLPSHNQPGAGRRVTWLVVTSAASAQIDSDRGSLFESEAGLHSRRQRDKVWFALLQKSHSIKPLFRELVQHAGREHWFCTFAKACFRLALIFTFHDSRQLAQHLIQIKSETQHVPESSATSV